jgi:hypothetical protein
MFIFFVGNLGSALANTFVQLVVFRAVSYPLYETPSMLIASRSPVEVEVDYQQWLKSLFRTWSLFGREENTREY